MSPPDIDLVPDALTAVHDALRAAADRLDGVGGPPAAPDAGAATADVLTIMAEVLARAGEVAIGSAAAAELVARDHAAYRDTESTNAANFGGVG